MSKPKLMLVDPFGLAVRYSIADGEENFSREARISLGSMRLALDAAGRVDFATGQMPLEQFLAALNERLRDRQSRQFSLSELVCLWTSTYEVEHEVQGELGAFGLPPYVFSSGGNEVDFDWLRARGVHKWQGCRGLQMGGLGRLKDHPAYYELLRLHFTTKVLCQEIRFDEMVMLDPCDESVQCAKKLGIDAHVVTSLSSLRAVLNELRSTAD